MTFDRVLKLPTGHNFRDLGGYPAQDGLSVKWRQVFRSGFMSKIAGDDLAQLRALGVDTICDLRANTERATRPTRWHEADPTELWTRDYDFSAGALFELLERPDVIKGEMHETMVNIYRVLPFEQADSYREMFRRLAAGRVPLVFNCSAGKDRTGVAAALLLSVLGVPRDVIEEDYLLTNAAMDGLVDYMRNEPKYAAFVTTRREHAMPLLRAESEYLTTSFAAIDAAHGSVREYMADILGISAEDQAAIRGHLLD
jgi:protein-tyrosine phosphatase